MSPYTASQELPLPVEILRETVKLLSPEEQRTFSLASQSSRKLALEFIFGCLQYTSFDLSSKIRDVHQAGIDVKDVIKKLKLNSRAMTIREGYDSNVLFQFLETLPNLHSLQYRQLGHFIRPVEFSLLFASLKHAPLRDFSFNTGFHGPVEGPPTAGLSGLENLAISWHLNDSSNAPGSSCAHLYEFVRPSLTTLVELKIECTPEEQYPDFDLRLLKSAGHTLRVFEYNLQSNDESILHTIPEIFPHLTKLTIVWQNFFTDHSILWKDAYINLLSKNENLKDLTLSSDFEESVDDSVTADRDFAWYIRCYGRRLTTTQDVVSACTQLERCSWVQLGIDHKNSSMVHPFIVEKRIVDGNVARIVRGIKQEWMGRDQRDWRTKAIVKCRLEDLPGEIVGENDVIDSE